MKEKEKVKMKEAKVKKAFNELWSVKNVKGVGERLHNSLKAIRGNMEITKLQGRYEIHPLFKNNQGIALERKTTKKREGHLRLTGIKSTSEIQPAFQIYARYVHIPNASIWQ